MLIEKIIKSIKKHRLIHEGDHVLACVSGGPDSVYMLLVLRELSEDLHFTVTVAHFNHLLRGKESDADEEFVRGMASTLSLPFVAGRGDVAAWRKEHGGSKPEAARILRYRFFNEEAKRLKVDKIALAHHADDQAETVLMRLLRGAGTHGLSGIFPLRENLYIRPILFARKKEILDFLRDRKVLFREDRSNLEADNLRNRIRLDLMPQLTEQFNPSLSDSLSRTAEILREEDDFLEGYVKEIFPSCILKEDEENVVFQRLALKGLHPAIQRRIIRMGVERVRSTLKRFSYSHLEGAIRLLEEDAVGKSLDWPDGLRILFSYTTVSITRKEKKKWAEVQAPLPVPGEIIFRGQKIVSEMSATKDGNRAWEEGKSFAWMDFDKVSLPFIVRSRKPGDRFQPLGMGSKKKLKELFINRKIPREDRDAIPLLISKGEIVWVGGVEVSDQVKISKETTMAVKVTLTSANGFYL